MSSLKMASRGLARVACQSRVLNGASRGFRSSARPMAAQNFAMPALSPTMTEGNISSWRVKEGDSFSAGDVLLEVETDKAQMDVEAQDDGKVAKITQEAGAKGVKVGRRIAVLAEAEDDLSSLEIPAEETSPQPAQSKSSEQQPEKPQAEPSTPASKSSSSPSSSSSSGKAQKQTYPLYPSIAQLLHENGIPLSDADKIPASGPKNRLLKGDVLAYLGRISKSYSADQSARITKLGHLDLSNIQIAAPKAAKPTSESTDTAPGKKPTSTIDSPPPTTSVTISISLSSVIAVQRRVQESLGITLPLSTFLARATELANEDLPRPAGQQSASQDELFNDVLGLNKIPSSSVVSRGNYIPQITAFSPSATSFVKSRPSQSSRKAVRGGGDVYDILTSTSNPISTSPASSKSVRGGLPPLRSSSDPTTATTNNLFSLTVAKGEEKRARTFLERVKTILQVEPGRLIL